MRTILIIAGVSLIVSGCRPSEEEVRKIVREELSAAGNAVYATSGKTIGPYSPAVRVGNFVFVSGQIGIDQLTGELVSGSIEAETRQALTNVSGVLSSQGYAMPDIVSATVYLKNMEDFQTMNGVYGSFFNDGRYPARATVEVSRLPRNANIEIAVIAYKNDNR